jgi:hypothetical protein
MLYEESLTELNVKVKVTVRLTVSQSVSLGVEPHLHECTNESESESESDVTTDGQSASLSWNKAPIWGLRPDFFYTIGQLRVC